MHWIAPSEKDTENAALEKRLWDINGGMHAQTRTLELRIRNLLRTRDLLLLLLPSGQVEIKTKAA